MTNFFLKGPIPILANDGPMNGIISLPFGCSLLLNTMFVARVLCIENAFFSSYRYQRYANVDASMERTIDPIIPPEYRLVAYFTPVFISFAINLIKLVSTKTNFIRCIRKYPQILIASCFTPFMFEGCKGNSIRIWKFGTVINALFIGCLPQIILFCMEFYRGIVNWDFVEIVLEKEGVYESNDALFKHRYGNCLFASISGILFLSLIIFTFSTNNIFKTRNTYCKCGFLSSICPQNFINFSKILCLSPTLEITSIPTVDEEDSIFYMYRYNNGSATLMMEDPISLKQITLKQVGIKFGYNSVEP